MSTVEKSGKSFSRIHLTVFKSQNDGPGGPQISEHSWQWWNTRWELEGRVPQGLSGRWGGAAGVRSARCLSHTLTHCCSPGTVSLADDGHALLARFSDLVSFLFCSKRGAGPQCRACRQTSLVFSEFSNSVFKVLPDLFSEHLYEHILSNLADFPSLVFLINKNLIFLFTLDIHRHKETFSDNDYF